MAKKKKSPSKKKGPEIVEQEGDLSAEEILDLARNGELLLHEVREHELPDTFTKENFEKFILGDITWAQLEGMTMEEAYAIADYGDAPRTIHRVTLEGEAPC